MSYRFLQWLIFDGAGANLPSPTFEEKTQIEEYVRTNWNDRYFLTCFHIRSSATDNKMETKTIKMEPYISHANTHAHNTYTNTQAHMHVQKLIRTHTHTGVAAIVDTYTHAQQYAHHSPAYVNAHYSHARHKMGIAAVPLTLLRGANLSCFFAPQC